MNSNRKKSQLYEIFWQTNWKIPNTNLTLLGHSKAAEKTGFIIPQLGIFLDAGIQGYHEPHYIFITHCHSDHTFGLPMLLTGIQSNPKIYVPNGTEDLYTNFIKSTFELSTGGKDIDLSFFKILGVSPKDSFAFSAKTRKFEIQVFQCDHTVPTVGYGFSEKTTKLKTEYHGLSGKKIKEMRENKEDIFIEKINKFLCYLGDTTPLVFELNPEILQYSTIIIECTFLSQENQKNAAERKHICWNDLLPYVAKNPNVTFVLIHFSFRSSDEEILEFFEKEKKANDLKNLIVWLDYQTEIK
ncbi:tRNAse z trz1 [Anaeramoeba ignava]|uniref:tRNAse z trz1 n=1 Tax=Anaeramoeba ignava TaxID=1746090 RepID=A0A9Q0L644_ANAIG|nr:tRNAse z trz1 [Anaeramoeba ignava]